MTVFLESLYTSDLNVPEDAGTKVVAPIRISPNVITLSVNGDPNVPVSGASQNAFIPVRAGGSRRYGIVARHLSLVRVAGTGADKYRVYRRVPILDPALFEVWVTLIDPTVEYETFATWIIAGAENEKYRLISVPVVG